jgi:large subunit ribosomal protein L33
MRRPPRKCCGPKVAPPWLNLSYRAGRAAESKAAPRVALTGGSCALSSARNSGGSGSCAMAKSNTVLIKLVSSADTGYFYVSKKNPRGKTEKLELKKYDPIAKKHVLFKEQKIK